MDSRIYYAGIGSRRTPQNVCTKISVLSREFYKNGLILRSGGAIGADTAFAMAVPESSREILRPTDATESAINIAARFHPNWSACNDFARKLHGRNVQIVLGQNLNRPVRFVVCWTPDGDDSGGTGQAMRVARHYDIPIFNLYCEHAAVRLAWWSKEVLPKL